MEWSKWIRGLSHEPKNGWFTRIDDAFMDLDTKKGGVYEIGLGSGDVPDSVVYCGRALCTSSGGGTSLRSRLFSGYAKSGSHLHVKMRTELEKGLDVFFRWAYLDTRESIARAETDLIAEGSYAWNVVSSKRAFLSKIETMIQRDRELKLAWLRELCARES